MHSRPDRHAWHVKSSCDSIVPWIIIYYLAKHDTTPACYRGLLCMPFSKRTYWNSSEVAVLSKMSTSAWQERATAYTSRTWAAVTSSQRHCRLETTDPLPLVFWVHHCFNCCLAPDFAVKPVTPCIRAGWTPRVVWQCSVLCKAEYARTWKCLFTDCVCSLESYQSKSCP